VEWVNVFGLVFIVVIMIPNIVFAIKCKHNAESGYKNKAAETIEQIGRFGCFGFMIFNIPGTCFGWWFDGALIVYLILNILLIVFYCTMWIICWKKNCVFRALALSIIPSIMFLLSGILERSILLVFSALLFAPVHILISYKSANCTS